MQFDQFQIDAVKKMTSGSILVGGVGSGKSRTALMYFFVKECGGKIPIDEKSQLYSPMTNPKNLYVITTAAKRDKAEWEQEMIPFCLYLDKDKCVNHIDIVIDSWNNIAKYIDVKDAFFIFDEQRVVGSGKWSKSFIQIAKNNHWILLSATPGDTWSDYIPVFIANGFYKNRTAFYTRHVVWSRYTTYPKIEKYLDVEHLEKLKSIILVDMDVKRSTVPHRADIVCEYDKKIYDSIVKDRWDPFKNEPIENASQYTQCLRRVVNTHDSRLSKILEIVESLHRVIIFYNFNYEVELLRSLAENNQIRYAEWNGVKHQSIPDCEEWIYLVQYNAGSEGWNCIKTNTIIFYSLNYSYRMMHQASGRINRRNTPYKDLWYYYLYTNSSIDKAILKALSEKKDFNEKRFYEKMDRT